MKTKEQKIERLKKKIKNLKLFQKSFPFGFRKDRRKLEQELKQLEERC